MTLDRAAPEQNPLDPEICPCPEELEVCAICLEALACSPATPFLTDSRPGSRAACVHYCHYACARRLVARRCPVCRAPFAGLKMVTREGVLAMPEDELCLALRRLHGCAGASVAVGLLSAVCPVSAQRLSTLMPRSRQPGAGENCVTAEVLAGLFGTLRAPEAPSRARPRLRLLSACRAFGSALNGCAVGSMVGAGVGLWLRDPPRHDERKTASGDDNGRPGGDHGEQILGKLAIESLFNVICEHGLVGIAVMLLLFVFIVVVLPALFWLFKRSWRFVVLALRSGHRALWVGMAACTGASAPAQVSRLLWSCSMWFGIGFGILCGFLHGASTRMRSEPALESAASNSLPSCCRATWDGMTLCYRGILRRGSSESLHSVLDGSLLAWSQAEAATERRQKRPPWLRNFLSCTRAQ